MERTLAREGFSCLKASSGGEAIRQVADAAVDLLLLDLKLQDMDGDKFLDQLEALGCRIPFIIITGQGNERAAVEMMKRGALDYLVKTTDFLELLPAVAEHALIQTERESRLALAERMMKAHDRRYRETLDGMLEGCQTLGFDWRYLYVNEAAARHGRHTVAELVGRTMMEVYGGIENTTLFSHLAECMQKRKSRILENEFYYSDGGSAWFQLSVQPVPEGLFVLSLNITNRKRVEAELNATAEEERGRIARDLHDGVGQELGAALLLSELHARDLRERGASEATRAAEIHALITKALDQVRGVSRGLYPVPPGPAGLMTALQHLAERVARDCQVQCVFDADSAVLLSDGTLATHLYRIAQEAVNNAVKHSGGTRIRIKLTHTARKLELSVRDNGAGLPANARSGLGWRTMTDRARLIRAQLAVQNAGNGGARVVCTLDKLPG